MITIENFLKDVEEWAKGDLHIESVIVVGSYACGTNKNTSDIDLCIITSNKETMVKNQDFTKIFGNIDKKQTEYYGKCTSIRVWYKEGREIEFGIVDPSWIESPLDAGTYKVLSDGYKVIIDKKHYFRNIDISKS
ncbi:nucleotidyltransferase domain-containing protein [Clostridium sp. MB05]|uniref:nucleotidyltransferase domain-containing protein n=1 Tax=Clostridium sp. MB05 TaxID=3376682 RepID=UPI003981F8C6